MARILRPDNLKTGVRKPDSYEPELNTAYREMSEYYGAFVSPARVRRPRDKAAVECAVIATKHIIAVRRGRKYFSLAGLNGDIRKQFDVFNAMPFQKREGSRESIFVKEEKEWLLGLPKYEYQIAEEREATVQNNYHVYVDKRNYSVPYIYVKHKVQIRLTPKLVEIFYKGDRIASHIRRYGSSEKYITEPGHMPEAHRHMAEWDADRFRGWATKYGRNTMAVINGYLASGPFEQQRYRRCMGLL